VTDPAQISKDPFFTSGYEGKRIILIPYSEDRDLVHIHAMFQDPRTTGPLGIDSKKFPIDKIRDQKRERMEAPDASDWTIFIKKGGDEKFAGEVGLVNWDYETHVVEIFAAISPDLSGKGYGRETVSILMERIFARSMIAIVRVQTLTTNKAALKLSYALGFRETGRRAVSPDPEIGFVGGIAVVMDCLFYEFRPYK